MACGWRLGLSCFLSFRSQIWKRKKKQKKAFLLSFCSYVPGGASRRFSPYGRSWVRLDLNPSCRACCFRKRSFASPCLVSATAFFLGCFPLFDDSRAAGGRSSFHHVLLSVLSRVYCFSGRRSGSGLRASSYIVRLSAFSFLFVFVKSG